MAVVSAQSRTRVVAGILLVAAALATLHLGQDLWDLVAHFCPALALVGLLVVGRYPGETLMARGRLRRAPAPRAARAGPVRRAAPSRVPRGTALLAYHRAVRPPPLTSHA